MVRHDPEMDGDLIERALVAHGDRAAQGYQGRGRAVRRGEEVENGVQRRVVQDRLVDVKGYARLVLRRVGARLTLGNGRKRKKITTLEQNVRVSRRVFSLRVGLFRFVSFRFV